MGQNFLYHLKIKIPFHKNIHIVYRCLKGRVTTNPCNCDAQLPEWTNDIGTITAKDLLPIKEVYYGPILYNSVKANFTIGQMKCHG